MYQQVKIVLINTTHPGNVGATARAMKNMGFSRLSLVAPKTFPDPEADARASGAEDILARAEVVGSLDEALEGCHTVFGLSARARKIAWPLLNVREAAEQIANRLGETNDHQVAILFGQEQSGLTNEALAKCHYQISIPANPDYASLNLAQAVQVMLYEQRMAILAHILPMDIMPAEKNAAIATVDEMESYFHHLEETLVKVQFLNPVTPKHLMAQLRRLYTRCHPTQVELNILRGILTAMQKLIGS
jgi:tRNA (cytidine32/uridine32-2'-O)-methyltransferase